MAESAALLVDEVLSEQPMRQWVSSFPFRVAYFVRGLAFRDLGDRAHALVEAEKAIELDPNYAGAHVLLATLLYFNERPQEALELMKRAIALNPNHPYNYSFHLGQVYCILKRYDEAITALNRVLESNPAAEGAQTCSSFVPFLEACRA